MSLRLTPEEARTRLCPLIKDQCVSVRCMAWDFVGAEVELRKIPVWEPVAVGWETVVTDEKKSKLKIISRDIPDEQRQGRCIALLLGTR